MTEERIFIISYDIANSKRWRKIFKILGGYGEWLQLSVFQCGMDERKKQTLISELDEVINNKEDHILFIDLGKASKVKTRIISLGKTFKPVEKKAFIF